MRSVLKNRGFRHLWTAGVLSTSGSEVSRLAVMLYLAREQQSGAALALWIALRALPGIVAAPWIGLLVDRMNQRMLLVAADLTRAITLLLVAVQPQASLIFAAAITESVASSVFEPTRRAAVPRLVRQDELVEANSLHQTSKTVLTIVCPVLGTHLFLQWGLSLALFVDAVSFLLSAILIARIVMPPPAGPLRAISWSYWDMVESWRQVAVDGRIRVLVALQFVSLLCAGLWAPIAPFFIRNVLHAGESQLGWQFSAFGLGGVLGGLLAPKLTAYWPTGRLLFGAVLLEGMHILVYSVATHWLISLLCICSWGIAVSVILVSSVSYLQQTVASSLLGGAFTLIRQSEQVGLLLAMGIAAGIAGVADSQLVFAAVGIIYVSTTLFAAGTRSGQQLWRPVKQVRQQLEPQSLAAGAPTFAEPVE